VNLLSIVPEYFLRDLPRHGGFVRGRDVAK
jgi:hypothetical protein